MPLLLMRSDFMDDRLAGPKLVEFNSIAAGMGPFGQRIHELHRFLKSEHCGDYAKWSEHPEASLIANPAIDGLSGAVAGAARTIRNEFNDGSTATFLMIVQAGEDNIFDQFLLEQALQKKGIRTIRKTFEQLSGALSTGEGNRLLLDGFGSIDAVYLRAGYEYCDYVAYQAKESHCCEALMKTRVFIEQHRVAMNATVAQQLATSKKVQMLLSSMGAVGLTDFGLTMPEATLVSRLLGEMRPIDEQTADWFAGQDSSQWVLKNQGEGGGHCIFDDDIAKKLNAMHPAQYSTWALMKRMHPAPRANPALVVRGGKAAVVTDLISEIGMFSAHIDGKPATDGDSDGYAGYLIRSKSALTAEGGVHSGQGVLDSLALLPS